MLFIAHLTQVCELDLIFNFQKVSLSYLVLHKKFRLEILHATLLSIRCIVYSSYTYNAQAYFVLDELIIAGEMQESSKKTVLRVISQQDTMEDGEQRERGWSEK
jgi:hypothetical protein